MLRYDNTNAIISLLNSLSYGYNYGGSRFGGFGGFGGYGGNGGYNTSNRLTYQEMTFDVTLKVLSQAVNESAGND